MRPRRRRRSRRGRHYACGWRRTGFVVAAAKTAATHHPAGVVAPAAGADVADIRRPARNAPLAGRHPAAAAPPQSSCLALRPGRPEQPSSASRAAADRKNGRCRTPASGSPSRLTGSFGRRPLPPSPPGRALDLRPQPPSAPHTWTCVSTAKPHAAAKSRRDRPVPCSRRRAEKRRKGGKKDTNGHTWTSQARTAPLRRFRRSTQPPDQAASCFAALRLVVSSSEPAHQPALLPTTGCQPSSAYRPPTKHHHHQPAPQTAIGECAGRKGPQGPPNTDHSTPDLLRWPARSVSGLP